VADQIAMKKLRVQRKAQAQKDTENAANPAAATDSTRSDQK